VPAPGLSSHLAARLRFPQCALPAHALRVPVPPPTLGPAAHRGGRRAGRRRLEGLAPRDNRSGGTQTVPAAALFVLTGASRRTR